MRIDMRAGCAGVIALVTLLVGATPQASAAGGTSKIVSVRSPSLDAQLRATAAATPTRTTVRVRGRVNVGAPRGRLVLVPCADGRCAKRMRGARTSPLRRGRYRIERVLHAPAVRVLRLQLRVGRRLVSSTALRVDVPRPSSPPHAPSPGPVPAPAPPVGEAPPPAADLSVTATPALEPSYSADVPDYTVACEPGQRVGVTTVVPPGRRVTVDGLNVGEGTSRRELALAAGQAFTFTIADAAGARSHTVRCTPQDFPGWTVERDGTSQLDWFAFTPSSDVGASAYSIIADARGVPVWWMRSSEHVPMNAQVLPDGSVTWGLYTGGPYSVTSRYEHVSLAGESLGSLTTVGVGTDVHEMQPLPNGNALLVAYVAREHVDLTALGGPADGTVLDAEIQEVSPGGTAVWSWNSKDHVGLSETASFGLQNTRVVEGDETLFDIAHINSVEPAGDQLVISLRHTDAVYAIDRPDGTIAWKLGGTMRPESLTVVGDPLGTAAFGGQHDARLLADGSLTVHDNGSLRARPPRAVRYAIDTVAGTATLLEQLVDERVGSSFCCGSARRLDGGDWLMSWGGIRVITELASGGRPVLTLRLRDTFSYRAVPVSASLVSRAQLHAGMDAQHPR